jgi:hypothetical protein
MMEAKEEGEVGNTQFLISDLYTWLDLTAIELVLSHRHAYICKRSD